MSLKELLEPLSPDLRKSEVCWLKKNHLKAENVLMWTFWLHCPAPSACSFQHEFKESSPESPGVIINTTIIYISSCFCVSHLAFYFFFNFFWISRTCGVSTALRIGPLAQGSIWGEKNSLIQWVTDSCSWVESEMNRFVIGEQLETEMSLKFVCLVLNK